MSDLTPKQEAFVAEYLVDLNATQAAIRCGYSEKTAKQQGSRLLTNADVQAAIAAKQAPRLERLEITAERVLEEAARIAFTNLADVADWGEREVAIGYDEDGKRVSPADIGDAVVVHHEMAPFLSLRDRDELSPAARSAVAEVALTKDGFRIKMHSKSDALNLLARHLGLLVEKHEVSGPNGGPVRVQAEVLAAVAKLTPAERAMVRALALKLEGG